MTELEHVRRICLALPETAERVSHGAPCFYVRDRTGFVYFHEAAWGHPNHEGTGRVRIWCPAPPGVQTEMVGAEPDRFFVPPYVGKRGGWLGVFLDEAADVDWDEVAQIVLDAYCKVAPRSLVQQVRPEA